MFTITCRCIDEPGPVMAHMFPGFRLVLKRPFARPLHPFFYDTEPFGILLHVYLAFKLSQQVHISIRGLDEFEQQGQ